jgi:hypothetical protein
MKKDNRPNFATDILNCTEGEPIEAVQIYQDDYSFQDGDPRMIVSDMLNRSLTWNEAKPLLDYKYDDEYGGQDCHNIVAWTPSKVLYVYEYDGSTHICSVPRNPPLT